MTAVKSCVLLLALLALHHAADAFDVQDCLIADQSDAIIVSLDVDSCPDKTADRCDFIKGTNATMSVEFIPSK